MSDQLLLESYQEAQIGYQELGVWTGKLDRNNILKLIYFAALQRYGREVLPKLREPISSSQVQRRKIPIG